jgi:Ca2+-transporting ATPase
VQSSEYTPLLDKEAPAGLTSREAADRLKHDGPNELGPGDRRNIGRILLDILLEPMFLLLIAAGSIYLLTGDIHEAMLLLAFVFIIIITITAQEYKTERVLETLRDLSSPRALVIRDSQIRRIAGREVVSGDILIMSEGDRVPADAVILSCHDLSADESMLTGESMPVRKQLEGTAESRVFAGTMIVQGNALARVVGTGVNTELGRIDISLRQLPMESSPLQKETAGLVRRLAIIGVGLALVMALLYIQLRGGWLNGLLAGITLAMSLLPQEFLVILTIFMALGARRISEQRVLTRRLAAIETLGETTVLCVDKTGTLTQNRMSVAALVVEGKCFYPPAGSGATMPETFHELLEYGILASEIDPYDPMEQAFHRLGREYLANTEHLHDDWVLVHEYELTPQMLAMSHLWRGRDNAPHRVAAKGAPEAVLDLCHVSEAEAFPVIAEAARLADEGYRVLGVARATHRGDAWPDQQHDFDFELLGLIALADPIRPEVPQAVSECRAAGIRVAMITGDYPATACAIGRKIGLDSAGVLTGAELELLDDEQLRQKVRDISIFARVLPEQKLRLVKALKANGEVVAMTGDGVNDAPALKAAHIGVAMGRRGTDVAREAASLVLLDDDFSAIVHAVRLGRRIFSNLRKAMSYTIAVHIPIAGLSILPLLFGWPLLFFPAHIVFMELVIDQACSIVFEAEPVEKDIMRRPPRSCKEPLFTRRHMLLSVLQGSIAMCLVGLVYVWMLKAGKAEDVARAGAFAALVFSSIGLIVSNRTDYATLHGNRTFIWVVLGTLTGLLLVNVVPELRLLFRFGLLGLGDWLTVSGVMLAGIALLGLSGSFLRFKHLPADS